jgi:chemotaxis protein MotB
MKNFTPLVLALSVGLSLSPEGSPAQTQDAGAVRLGEAALAFAAGSIQKSTPRDGIVNLITGDNQTTGDRFLLGGADILYLKLTNPAEVAVGDLFTVYRRVRKVFHPMTAEYLGLVTIRLAVVRAVQVDHNLTTVKVIQSYDAIAPGDPVMRYTPPPDDGPIQAGESADIKGMIVELRAEKNMTLVSQTDIVYLDRGRDDGVKPGNLMEIYRGRRGLPTRKIGQLKILSTEGRTATARILKSTTHIMKGDEY